MTNITARKQDEARWGMGVTRGRGAGVRHSKLWDQAQGSNPLVGHFFPSSPGPARRHRSLPRRAFLNHPEKQPALNLKHFLPLTALTTVWNRPLLLYCLSLPERTWPPRGASFASRLWAGARPSAVCGIGGHRTHTFTERTGLHCEDSGKKGIHAPSTYPCIYPPTYSLTYWLWNSITIQQLLRNILEEAEQRMILLWVSKCLLNNRRNQEHTTWSFQEAEQKSAQDWEHLESVLKVCK